MLSMAWEVRSRPGLVALCDRGYSGDEFGKVEAGFSEVLHRSERLWPRPALLGGDTSQTMLWNNSCYCRLCKWLCNAAFFGAGGFRGQPTIVSCVWHHPVRQEMRLGH